MGQLDQFAKDTLDRETASVTHGAAAFQVPPELSMSEVRLDGMILVRDPSRLATLAAPWALAGATDELVVEVKMPGDHLDMIAVDRALLRRQARQVQRREDETMPWAGEVPLWLVAPHVPAALAEHRMLELLAPGCYRVGPSWFPFLWIAANELPLADELVPFLIARTGRALDEFVRWVKTRRPIEWLVRVLEYLPMSTAARDDLRSYMFPRTDDPVIRARQREIAKWAFEASPETREELTGEARLEGSLKTMRSAVRDVLAQRRLALSSEDEARIAACADLDTLQRWLKQAVLAAGVTDALR